MTEQLGQYPDSHIIGELLRGGQGAQVGVIYEGSVNMTIPDFLLRSILLFSWDAGDQMSISEM